VDINEIPAHAIFNEIEKSAHAGSYHGQAAEHCFECRNAERLEMAGHAEQTCTAIKRELRIAFQPTFEYHAVGDSVRFGDMPPAVRVTDSGHTEFDIAPFPRQSGNGLKELIEPLGFIQSAGKCNIWPRVRKAVRYRRTVLCVKRHISDNPNCILSPPLLKPIC
jgi:hypothetical protein